MSLWNGMRTTLYFYIYYPTMFGGGWGDKLVDPLLDSAAHQFN